MDPGEYWVFVVGKGYFVRFESHGRAPRWFTATDMRNGYCFKTIDDAQRVVEQLGRYRRKAQIMKERKAAPPPPPPLPESPFGPPGRLKLWVDKIVAASNGGDIKAGYRALARKHHPDRGGKTADMQALTEAYAWLRANPQERAIPFEDDPFTEKWEEPIWEDPIFEEPLSELTDDDIPF